MTNEGIEVNCPTMVLPSSPTTPSHTKKSDQIISHDERWRMAQKSHDTTAPIQTRTEPKSSDPTFEMQSNDELHSLAIAQTANEPALLELDCVQVCVDDILCIANKPFEEKLEQLKAVFQRLRLNANAALLARAAWNCSGQWISQNRNPLATRNACGI
jgi:hypothetical protein